MSEEYSGRLTPVQALAVMTRLKAHFGMPKKDASVNVGKGPWAKVPDAYSPGAPGWSARPCRVVLDKRDNSARIHVPPAVKALIGTQVGGSTLNLGTLAKDEDLGLSETNSDDAE